MSPKWRLWGERWCGCGRGKPLKSSMNGTSRENDASSQKEFVLALDVGTTKVKTLIFNKKGDIVGQSSQPVELVYPRPGWIEIVPDQLWSAVVLAIKEVLKKTELSASDLRCMGISTQRATFTTWDRDSGKEFHNFITWKDVRADSLVKAWNNSLTMKGLRLGSGFLYGVTRQKRFRVASILQLQNKMVNMRLLWAYQNVPEFREAASRGRAHFGTLDTWLLYRFSRGFTYLSEIACASATGLFDPFTLDYGDWAFRLFGIPRSIMPPVVDSAGPHFGAVHHDIFGAAIPIRAVMADQSAAVFGSGCLHRGDTKLTLGTGSFLDTNTGRDPHASINGLVPVVGWRYGDALCFLAEGSNHDTSSIIEWAKQIELFEHVSESSEIASGVDERDFNVYFVPSFFGLQAPINDPDAGAGFIGITPRTTKSEMLRAVLEAIAFTMKQLQETMEAESEYKLENIQIDGGVSRNDFVVQMISDVTGKVIERADNPEMASFGAAFMAGLDSGLWHNVHEMSKLRRCDQVFEPSTDAEHLARLRRHYKRWVDACYRFTDWYR